MTGGAVTRRDTGAGPDAVHVRVVPAAPDEARPGDIVSWAHRRFGDGLVVTASFGDAVLVHLAATHAPGVQIALIDTGYLFAETHWYADRLKRMLDLNLTIIRSPIVPDDRWQHDTAGCCAIRKVAPLDSLLHGRRAWITGVRRADGPTRADAAAAGIDARRDVIKVNPIVAMTDAEVDQYHERHGLPRHPLSGRGYPSIGCWPCTRPADPGDDARSGRWAGSTKTECGLHL